MAGRTGWSSALTWSLGAPPHRNFCFLRSHRDLTVPVNVLIRPRFGDFLYTRQELAQMEEEIARFRDLGANGVVIGVLTADGELDIPNLVRLKQAAGAMDVTLHRAFDMVRDQKRALEQAIHLGFTTILTSGGQGSALKGSENLAELNALAGDSDPAYGRGRGKRRQHPGALQGHRHHRLPWLLPGWFP